MGSDSSAASWMEDSKNKKNKRRGGILFKRSSGELRLEQSQQVVRCRMLLNDLSPTGVGLFLESKVEIGGLVTLVLEQPRHMFLKGEVLWCNLYTLHNSVISTDAFLYRAGVRFSFTTPKEAEEFKNYCDSLFAQLAKS